MSTETLKKEILDVEEFCKLYKVNIPVESEKEYYIETLLRSEEYRSYNNNLQGKIDTYVDLEEFVSKNGYSKVRDYKNECMDLLKNFILNSQAYKTLMEAEFPTVKLTSKDLINLVEEVDYLLSFDFKSANYSVLKTFDTENELESSWKDLCAKFNVHKALVDSKSFRQIVFGSTSPKRLQTFQHVCINKLLWSVQNIIGTKEEDIVFISHDEIVIRVKSADKVVQIQDNYLEYMSKLVGMPIKLTPYSLKKIKKNTFIKTIHGINTKTGIAATENKGMYYFTDDYQTLHGVPGNKYYMYFKKFILNKETEPRDLMYVNDGELCLWIDEDAKKKKKNLPHYEKPRFEYTLKSAREEYPYLWNELGNRLPDMANEEKRRVIELVANTCKHCFQNETPCTCWKDE